MRATASRKPLHAAEGSRREPDARSPRSRRRSERNGLRVRRASSRDCGFVEFGSIEEALQRHASYDDPIGKPVCIIRIDAQTVDDISPGAVADLVGTAVGDGAGLQSDGRSGRIAAHVEGEPADTEVAVARGAAEAVGARDRHLPAAESGPGSVARTKTRRSRHRVRHGRRHRARPSVLAPQPGQRAPPDPPARLARRYRSCRPRRRGPVALPDR